MDSNARRAHHHERAAGGLARRDRPRPEKRGRCKVPAAERLCSQNYRISVKITFSRGFDGCAGIFTRASAAGRYLTAVCGDGSVDIEEQGAHGKSLIYLKFTRRALTYTVTAISQGADQSVYVNRAKIGTIADASFSKTEYLGLGIVNKGNATGTVVFRKFTFTPLPASRRS